MRYFWIIFCPTFFFGQLSYDINTGLRALQQIRTLIPERLSDEEFSIIVDRKAFAETMKNQNNSLHETGIPSAKAIGCSQFYLSRWTISGEPVRILDFYQEFEYGPYWLYPTAVERLYDMHHESTPGISK